MSQNRICRAAFNIQSMICVLASLALAGCAGETSITSVSKNTFEINYTESAGMSSPALVQNYMNEAAMERCPRGYNKLTDRTIKQGYMPTHIWKVTCIQ